MSTDGQWIEQVEKHTAGTFYEYLRRLASDVETGFGDLTGRAAELGRDVALARGELNALEGSLAPLLDAQARHLRDALPTYLDTLSSTLESLEGSFRDAIARNVQALDERLARETERLDGETQAVRATIEQRADALGEGIAELGPKFDAAAGAIEESMGSILAELSHALSAAVREVRSAVDDAEQRAIERAETHESHAAELGRTLERIEVEGREFHQHADEVAGVLLQAMDDDARLVIEDRRHLSSAIDDMRERMLADGAEAEARRVADTQAMREQVAAASEALLAAHAASGSAFDKRVGAAEVRLVDQLKGAVADLSSSLAERVAETQSSLAERVAETQSSLAEREAETQRHAADARAASDAGQAALKEGMTVFGGRIEELAGAQENLAAHVVSLVAAVQAQEDERAAERDRSLVKLLEELAERLPERRRFGGALLGSVKRWHDRRDAARYRTQRRRARRSGEETGDQADQKETTADASLVEAKPVKKRRVVRLDEAPQPAESHRKPRSAGVSTKK